MMASAALLATAAAVPLVGASAERWQEHKPIAIQAPRLLLQDDAAQVAVTFVRAMASGDEETVWMFATEEEQDAFGTESEAYAAYAEAFPALIQARAVVPESSWREGETPFVEARVTDRSGETYRATLGFWLSDAGDWQLISCDVKADSDRVAGL